MKEPEKILPKNNSDYLRVMTRAVFQAGFNWKVIEKNGEGLRKPSMSLTRTKSPSITKQKFQNFGKTHA